MTVAAEHINVRRRGEGVKNGQNNKFGSDGYFGVKRDPREGNLFCVYASGHSLYCMGNQRNSIYTDEEKKRK